jgi:hypothetical protein
MVIYDTGYGHTGQIALAIGQALGGQVQWVQRS